MREQDIGNGKKIYRDTNLQLLFGVTLMAVMGVAVIAPAFPKIARELGLSSGQVGLLVILFTLPGVVLAPVLGVLADRVGRKAVMVPSLLLFGAAGVACSFSRDFGMLIIFRVLQGTGAASLFALNVTLIGDLYMGRSRAEALGYNAGVLSMGTAGYPALGGMLAAAGWYYPFALSAVAIPLALLVWKYLENPRTIKPESLGSYFRNVLTGFTDPQVAGLFAASLIAFVILYGSYITYFPLLLGGDFGAGPVVIGLIMSTLSITTGIVSTRAGWLLSKFSVKKLVVAGFCLYAAAMFTVPLVEALPYFLITTVLYGLAQGINIPVIQIHLNELAPDHYRAAFMAANGLVIRIGQTVGPLLMLWVEQTWRLDAVFVAGAMLGLAGASVLAVTMPRRSGK
ncbi:MAG: MFS transporter [Candidatus Glassbacteria bacterium]|nr:MFS transporter [Candidatus Glassbacteria bacterium]